MLYVVFRIRTDRYAIPVSQIVEILPVVRMKKVPHAPPGIVGVFNYHGTAVPVIDLTLLTSGIRCQQSMTTRLAITKYPRDGQPDFEPELLLGLIGEQLTETMRAEEKDFLPPNVSPSDTPYLDSVAVEKGGFVQRLNILELLPEQVRQSLFASSREVMENNAPGH
jgi:chemotaxis-related protein WspB